MKNKNKMSIIVAFIFMLALPLAAFAQSAGGWDVSELNQYGLPNGSISGIIHNLLLWILGLFGLFGVLGFVISGIMYLTSTGDDTRIKSAKSAMTYSFMGVVVGLVGVVIIQAVYWALSASYFF